MRAASDFQESPGQITNRNQIVDSHKTVWDMAEKNEEFRCVEEKSCVDKPAEGVDQHKTSVQKPQQWRNIPLQTKPFQFHVSIWWILETDVYILTYILHIYLQVNYNNETGGIADITTVVQWICFSNNRVDLVVSWYIIRPNNLGLLDHLGPAKTFGLILPAGFPSCIYVFELTLSSSTQIIVSVHEV